MAITRISKFITSDGAEFDAAKDANTHEQRLALIEVVGGADKLAELEKLVKLTPPRKPRRTPEEKAAADAEKAAAKAAKATAADAAAKAKSDKPLKAA